jgi:hypothetical protein
MTTQRTDAASVWLGQGETHDWFHKAGEAIRTVLDAMDAGRQAEYDYRQFANHGLQPPQASAAVFKKHFR